MTPDDIRIAANKAAGRVDYILADHRTQLTEFYQLVYRTRPGEKWEFGEAYPPDKGCWFVVWQVGDIALVHPAKWSRAFVRDLRESNSPRKRPDLHKDSTFADMLGDWDVWAKRVLERNRRGDGPADTPPPLLRSIEGGKTLEQEVEQVAAPPPPKGAPFA